MNKSKSSKYGKYRVNVNDIIGVRFGNLVVVKSMKELSIMINTDIYTR